MKIAVGLCACVLVAVAAIYATKGSKETPPADTSLARATPQPSTAPKTAVEVPNISPPKAQAPSEKKIATKTVSPIEDTGSRIGLAGMTDPKGPPAGPVILAPTEDIKPTPKPATATEINDIIGKPRTKKAAGGDEEEAPLVIAEKPKAVEKPVEPAAETKPVAPDAPPEKADKADDDEDLGKDGKPKKPKRSLLDNLGGDAPQPVKHEIEKKEKENPFAIKTVPVTATEPTIMPLDIEKVSGNDRTLTEQLIVFLPNWRVRDVNYNTTTKIGDKHQGRDNVIVLNPLNDVLPAKLMATIEIPKNFAGAHPTVLFEISSAVNGKDWALSVKAMGVDMFPRTKVKLPKDAPWHEVAIDLSQLADKHFDFQIEVNATGKHPKGTASEIGYIRNVRFEWTGKKK